MTTDATEESKATFGVSFQREAEKKKEAFTSSHFTYFLHSIDCSFQRLLRLQSRHWTNETS